MDEKNKQIYRYFVGLLFVISFLYEAVGSRISFLNVLPWIGLILMAVSMFSGIYELLAVGTGVQAIWHLIYLVGNIFGWHGSKFSLTTSIYNTLFIVGYALVIYCVFKRQSAAKMSILISSLFLAGWFVRIYDMIDYPAILVNSLRDFFYNSCLPIILALLVLSNTPKNCPAKSISVTKKAETATSQIDNLVKLKELLDAGTLSQEEFDEKKKQILGL